jgi:hypothetical protein
VMGAVLGKIVKGAAKMTFEQTPRWEIGGGRWNVADKGIIECKGVRERVLETLKDRKDSEDWGINQDLANHRLGQGKDLERNWSKEAKESDLCL